MAAVRPRASRILSVAFPVLATIATIDLVSELARFAIDADDRYGWLRLVVCAVATVVFSTGAIRLRSRGRAAEVDCHRELEREVAADRRLSLSPRLLKWLRRLRWALVAGLLVGAGFTIAGQWGTLGEVGGLLHHLRWRWLRWSVYLETGSIVAYALLTRTLLKAGGHRLQLRSILGLTLAGNALLVSLPGGVAWATGFSFRAFRRRGVPTPVAFAALIGGSVISGLALVALALVGVDLAGGSGPLTGMRPVVSAAAATLALAILIAALWMRRRPALLARLRSRIPHLQGRYGPRVLAGALVAAAANWALDCGCLIGAILAVSGRVPWEGILVAYGAAQIVQNLPITPGGIGVVEGSLTVLLVAYGLHSGTALAAVLLYRLISFWIMVPIGWAAVGAIVIKDRRAGAAPVPAVSRSRSAGAASRRAPLTQPSAT